MREKRPIAAGDTNIYILVDEYGYADTLYTAKTNLEQDDSISEGPNNGFLVYLTLEYSPYNKYVDICNRFQLAIAKNEQKKAKAADEIEQAQKELDSVIEDQTGTLTAKEKLNQKLEKVLGPALREGYWTPDEYEEIGKRKEASLSISEGIVEGREENFFFDTELFEEEEAGFYYASGEALTEEKKTYFSYIDISDYINVWNDGSYGNLVLHLQNPSFKYIAQEHNALAAGNYFFPYETINYYFKLDSSLKENDVLEIKFSLDEANPQLFLTQNGNTTVIPTSKEKPKDVVSSNVNILFERISQYLGDYKLYPNAGFIYAFIKKGGKVIPVILLNNNEIQYDVYEQIAYSFTDNETKGIFPNVINNTSFEICYPRIVINKKDVNYESDLLSIKNNGALLTKFEDYYILTRKGEPYFTIKVNNNNSVKAILNNLYDLIYYVSQANEILYQDAKEVAKENSRPRFSYSVQVSQVPSNIESFELGQLGYISDSELGIHAAQGYISQIVLQLDSPKDDEITIQNYKTKFEDLFSTITASSEAMKTNQHSYDIAASGFTSKGEIDGSILQDTFDNNKIELTYSNTNVRIDDLDGIVLTNTEPYTNGVYGQVVLQGGGIFLSNTVDSNEERIWTTGITPNGINASTITTGQLDANLVRIFAGNNLAFQWNSEGLYAYKRDEETNSYLPNTYVRYSDKGLQYLDNGFVAVDLGWNGLMINSQDGSVSLTGQDGLIVYDGLKNSNGTNYVVKLGRFGEQENYTYGLRLYKKNEEGNYNETLITSNNGQLWLKDYLSIGNSNNAYIKSYKWQYREPNSVKWRNSPLTSANTPILLIPTNSLTRDNLVYRCIITTSDEKEIISKEVTLKMLEDADFYIRKHPRDAVVSEDSVVEYQVTAVGNNLRYQWQYSKDGGFSWEDSQDVGSNTDTLTIKAVLAPNSLNGVKYRVIVTNESNEIEYSDAATLTINNNISEPIITKQPSNIAAKLNSNGITIEVDVLEALTNSGISGLNEQGIKSVRFWAGDDFSARSSAPFRVLHDGTVVATKIFIGEDSTINDIKVAEVTQVTELAQIKEGQVVIADGKVIANSIAANAITTNAIAANAITTEKISSNFDLEIGAGRSINITTEGSFTIESDNFKVNADGDVSLTGEITAKSGSIGGWNIDETSTLLYSGEGNKYVALSSDANQTYSIWAGAEDPSKAAFAVTNEGHVYLEKVYVQTDIDENGDPIYAAKSLTEYPLWAIWPAYNGRIIEVTSSEENGQITLTFNRSQGEPLTVNFKKAAVNSSNYYIQFNGSGSANFSASLMQSGSTSSSTGISAYANLKLNLNKAQSTVTVVPTGGSTIASISVEDVYNSVTVDSIDVDGTVTFTDGNYAQIPVTATASNTLKMMTILSVDCAKVYNKGISDAKSKITLSFDPEQDTDLDYGKSIDVKATILYDNESIGITDYIKITAPPDNFSDGASSVGFNTSPISWENGTVTIALTNGKSKSIGSPNNCPNSWTTDHKGTVYVVHGSSGPLGNGIVDASSVYQAGYEAAKNDAKIKYSGTEEARVISSGSTKVTIVNDSGAMITGTFVSGGTLKTYNIGAYIAYE